MANRLEEIMGGMDCKFIDAVATEANGWDFFVVNADCVLTLLTAAGNGTDVNCITRFGLTSKTIKQGMLVRAPMGLKFTAITPSSGSVIAYVG